MQYHSTERKRFVPPRYASGRQRRVHYGGQAPRPGLRKEPGTDDVQRLPECPHATVHSAVQRGRHRRRRLSAIADGKRPAAGVSAVPGPRRHAHGERGGPTLVFVLWRRLVLAVPVLRHCGGREAPKEYDEALG